jgi:hypothetical protein
MDLARLISATVALVLGGVVLAMTSRGAAVPRDSFVVNTQFASGPSAIVEAAGSFSGCRQATDLESAALDHGSLHFTGNKLLTCASEASVLLRYDVSFDATTEVTTGTWRVTSSTLPGVEVGDRGTLIGDPGGCTVTRRACGCILDRFTLTS